MKIPFFIFSFSICVIQVLSYGTDQNDNKNFSCGVIVSESTQGSRIRPLVSGGNLVVSAKRWPWMASLHMHKDTFLCTASIISPSFVLTAGHCFLKINKEANFFGINQNQSDFSVGVGGVDYLSNDTQIVDVEEIFVQKDFLPSFIKALMKFSLFPKIKIPNSEGDIALIKLRVPLNFTDTIRPICLSNGKLGEKDGDTANIVGWGSTDNDQTKSCHAFLKLQQCGASGMSIEECVNKTAPPELVNKLDSKLRYGEVSLFSSEQCNQILGENDETFVNEFNNQTQICEHGNISNVGKGDSGGPLMTQRGRNWFQLGVTSHTTCKHGLTTSPDIYTRVSAYCAWISEVTKGEATCY